MNKVNGILELDGYSLRIVIAAAGFALSVIFLTLRSAAPRYRGFSRWALCNALIACGFLLQALQPDESPTGSVLPYTLIVAGVAFLSNGVWASLGRSARYEPLAFLPPLAALPLLSYFAFVDPKPAFRAAVFAAILAVQFGATAAVIFYRYPFKRKAPAWFTSAVFGLLAVWLASSALSALSGRSLHPAFVLVFAVGLVSWTLGLGVMTAFRLAEELAAHEQRTARLRSDAIVKTIIDTLPQYVVLKDRDSRFIAGNAAFARLVKRPAEQLPGLRDADVFPPETAEKHVRDDREVMGEGLTREYIERRVENGQELWIETVKTPVLGPEGQCEGVLAVFRDVTERKRNEVRLRESERSYRELSGQLETRVAERTRELERAMRDSDLFFEVSLEYLCLSDFSGRLQKLSPSWSKNLGWSEAELKGRPLLNFIHPEDRRSAVALARELIAGGRILDKANRFRRSDGSWVWLSWSAVGLPDRGLVLAAAHDITARVETEERLRSARETAEAASRAKSQFISTMSHELRTPLNAVLGYAGLLSPLLGDASGERYIKSIESSGRALLAIINDLLDLTKVESGRIELNPAPADPRRLMDEIAEIFRFGAEEKGLYLEFKSTELLPKTILIDAARLRQVFINLVGNSIKFTDRGSVRVFFDADIPPEARGAAPTATFSATLRIGVEDTGIGMAEHYRARLFEPFSQQDAAIARNYGGTGLGLAIAKRLLDLMGGTISCDSEPGRGTRFRIEIPDVRSAGSAPEVLSFIGGERAAAQAAGERPRSAQKGRVAVAVRDEELAAALAAALAGGEFDAAAARDYASALKEARGADLILAEEDEELLDLLAEDPALSGVPILLVAAGDGAAASADRHRPGVVDRIVGPVDAEELHARMRIHIDLKKTRDDLLHRNAELSYAKRAVEEKNQELETLVARLDKLSMTDELTGLANRRAVSARLAEEVARARRTGKAVSVLIGDLDHLNQINDSLGHDAGDAVLAECARRFSLTLRESDTLGRWGGEEFLAVLPETSLGAALRAAERARARIGDTPIAFGSELVRATVSIGVAYLEPKASDAPDACAGSLLRAAEENLYLAKEKGRNRVEGAEAALEPAERA